MRTPAIQDLFEAITNEFGDIELYGSNSNEQNGICFKVNGILATFSAHTLDGQLDSTYDLQVEGIPAGDYVYTTELALNDFIALIHQYKQPENQWP